MYVRIQQNPQHYAATLGAQESYDWQQSLDDFVNVSLTRDHRTARVSVTISLKVAVQQLSEIGLVEVDGPDVADPKAIPTASSAVVSTP